MVNCAMEFFLKKKKNLKMKKFVIFGLNPVLQDYVKTYQRWLKLYLASVLDL